MIATSCLVLVLAIPTAPPGGASPWLTGYALQKELQEPLDLAKAGGPLRKMLGDLSLQRRVAIYLDRRVDPDGLLNLAVRDVPLEKALAAIARAQGLGLTFLGPVAYFGPPQTTARLRTVVELCRDAIRALPAPVARKFFRALPMRWDDLATPRELVAQLAAESDLQIVAAEQIPHDLWAGADLPPLSLIERLTLLLGQFDLTFAVDASGDRITLVPEPADVALVRSYLVPRDPQPTAARWAALLPAATIQVAGNRIIVRARVEEHEQLAAAQRPATQKATPAYSSRAGRARPEDKRFTVRLAKGKLDFLLQQYTRLTDVELKLDRESFQRAGVSLDQEVAFSVKEATLDELFQAIAASAGCRCHRTGRVIVVEPPR
jgi:hypothetical protein